MSVWSPVQKKTGESLIGVSEDGTLLDPRPSFDPSLSERLKKDLEGDLADLRDELDPSEPLYVSKYALAAVFKCEGLFLAIEQDAFQWEIPLLRGRISHQAISTVGLVDEQDPITIIKHAIEHIRAGSDSAAGFIDQLTSIELAELIGNSVNDVEAFLTLWPPLQPTWRPAIEFPVKVRLLDGRIVLGGKYDLSLGRPSSKVARKIIIDLKTGKERPEEHLADLRFYALIETLWSGVQPFRVATHYLQSNLIRSEDVTEDVLESALRRTIDGVRKVFPLKQQEDEPSLRGGPWCQYCSRNEICTTGIDQLNAESGTGAPWN